MLTALVFHGSDGRNRKHESDLKFPVAVETKSHQRYRIDLQTTRLRACYLFGIPFVNVEAMNSRWLCNLQLVRQSVAHHIIHNGTKYFSFSFILSRFNVDGNEK